MLHLFGLVGGCVVACAPAPRRCPPVAGSSRRRLVAGDAPPPFARAACWGPRGGIALRPRLKGDGSVIKRLLSSLSFERVWRAPTSSEGVAHRLKVPAIALAST